MRRILIHTILIIFISHAFLHSREVNEPKKIYQIPRTSGNVNLDGRLDEKAWNQALVVDLDIEFMPAENVDAPVKTECFLTFDDNHLYVGFKAYDPEPQKIRAYLADRDALYNDDVVGILLDTFNDQNRAYAFYCNPLGVQGDEIFSQGGSKEDYTWDAIWDSAGRIQDSGYTVEMAIPFRSLQFPHSSETHMWGFAPIRNYPRSRRHQMTCFPLERDQMQCILCQIPKLKGFQNVKPGRNIELDPTLTGIRTDQREDFPEGKMEKERANLDPGISGQWGFTHNLTLSAAANPDFSQVEADAAQLDINKQFALYYPEKRPFFLEGTDFFNTPIQALYTRSVADPNYGIKISGKEGKNAIGIFSSQDTLTNLLFPGAEGSTASSLGQNSYANVIRYRRDVGKSSTLGLLATDREGEDYHNRLVGLDGILRITQSDTFAFQFLGSQTAYPEEVAKEFSQDTGELKGYAVHMEFARQKRSYLLYGTYDDFSPEFRADLGFVPQVDCRKFEVGGGYLSWGKPDEFFTSMEITTNYDQTNTHDGRLLEKELEARAVLEGPLQSMAMWVIGARKKTYRNVPFDQFFNHFNFEIKPVGDLSTGIFFSLGDEIDYTHVQGGKYLQASPFIEFRYGRHVELSLSHDYNHLNVEEGRLFTANATEVRLFYHLNSRAFFRAILQFWDIDRTPELYESDVDARFNRLFSQLLFSYKLNPRTVLFLGYSDNYYGFQNVELTQSQRTFFFKIGYAWNL